MSNLGYTETGNALACKGSIMIGDSGWQPNPAGCAAFVKVAVVAVIAGAALLSACSQPSDTQPPAAQQQAADEQARREAGEKTGAEARKDGPVAAYTGYLQ